MKRIVNNVSVQQLEVLSRELQRRTGVALAGPQGEMEVRGFRVQYSYDEAQQTLAFELKSKPWYVPQRLIETKVDEFLAGPGKDLLEGKVVKNS
jgi:hypothetical protein